MPFLDSRFQLFSDALSYFVCVRQNQPHKGLKVGPYFEFTRGIALNDTYFSQFSLDCKVLSLDDFKFFFKGFHSGWTRNVRIDSAHFLDLVQNTRLVRYSYPLRLSNFCEALRRMRMFPQKCQKIVGC